MQKNVLNVKRANFATKEVILLLKFQTLSQKKNNFRAYCLFFSIKQ